jgi:hypothetical protein
MDYNSELVILPLIKESIEQALKGKIIFIGFICNSIFVKGHLGLLSFFFAQ